MIQQLIDKAIADGTNYVRIPDGTYHLDKGLVVGNRDGSFLESFKIEGTLPGYGGAKGVRIIVPGNSFGIAFQRCKGFRLGNIFFEGENKLWQYSAEDYLWNEDMNWFNGCAENHAAILVDPFHKNATDRYPGFEDWYENDKGAGSTDGIIDSASVRYFSKGIQIHNGTMTGNGDCISINNSWVDYCKYGIETGFHQNRSVFVNNLKCWGGVHTLFHAANGVGCPVEGDGLNIAGGVRYLAKLHGFANNNGITIRRAHTEMLSALNPAEGIQGRMIIRDSWVNLISGRDVVFTGRNFVLDGSTLTHYGSPAKVMKFDCYTATFINSTFDAPPMMANKQTQGKIKVMSCDCGGELLHDDATVVINLDSNEGTRPWTISPGMKAVLKSNYGKPEVVGFEPMDGYYVDGYVRKFFPHRSLGLAKGKQVQVLDVKQEWQWNQYQPGTYIPSVKACVTGYDFSKKTIYLDREVATAKVKI